MTRLRVLALAPASGRIGSVFLVAGELIDWQISTKGARSGPDAAAHTQELINDFHPDVVVTEDPETARRKGGRTLALIAAVARTAEHNQLLGVSLPRRHDFANKYLEAEALVEQFPDLEPWQPRRRRFYDNEPRNTVIFEALALALQLKDHT